MEATEAALEATLQATPAGLPAQAGSLLDRLPSLNVNIPVFLGLTFFLGLFFLLWVTIFYFVVSDMDDRPIDPRLKNMIIILTLFFNFIGLLLYLLSRPPTFDEIERVEKEDELLDLELKKLRKDAKNKT